MAVMTPLGPLPFLGSWGAALTAETMGTAKSGELPGPPCEAKALFVPCHHHELAQRGHGPGLRLAPRSSRWQGRPSHSSKRSKGRCADGWAKRHGALVECALFIQQDEVIAPSTNQKACSVDDI